MAFTQPEKCFASLNLQKLNNGRFFNVHFAQEAPEKRFLRGL